MGLNKAQKFTVAVLGGTLLMLFLLFQYGDVSVNLNDWFNGTLQAITGGIITMALTIWVYRSLYHRKSKN